MSSKKLLAASMAAVLATGTIAAVATADAPADAVNDEYTVVISGVDAGAEYIKSAKLSIKTSATSNAFAATKAGIDAAKGDMSKLGFSSIKAGLWEAFEDFNITETSSAKLGVTVKGKAQEYAQDQFVRKVTDTNGEVSYAAVPLTNAYLPKLKDGKKYVLDVTIADSTNHKVAANDTVNIVAILDEDGKTTHATTSTMLYKATSDDADITATAFVAKAVAQAQDKIDAVVTVTSGVFAPAATDGTKLEAAAEIDVEAVAEAQDLGTTWRSALETPDGWTRPSKPNDGATPPQPTGHGKNLGPVTLTPEFSGLSDTVKLVSIGDALFTLEAELTVDGTTYTKYVEKNYAVNGAAGDWKKTAWDNSSSTFNDSSASKIGLGIVANSTVAKANAANNGTGDGSYDAAGTSGWCAKAPDANLEKAPELEKDKKDLYLKKESGIDLSYFGIVNPNVLKNLNNGGTVTFTLDKPLNNATLYGSVEYRGADGWHIIDADDNYVISGNEITFNFPAGLTYHPDLPDQWHAFAMAWRLDTKTNNSFGGIWENNEAPSVTEFDGKIVQLTFRANKGAGVDDPSVGGDGENSGNGGNTSNPGSTSGNPNTGIALAVAPIVLAAGAVVTIASKKRK